ncbi:oxidoreductase vrtI-like [Bradysia coprophila]|uniref:oxidoreductase vrtI-like n=1 Tax=Bradysia coprophila TaxID=38358 RepID=UPI00187D8C08|nr:oxidoreductase vrtI-like [Bradysia coprophila]
MDLLQPVSNISLPVIDYTALVKRDSTEIQKIVRASTELGFFYLKVDNQLDPDPMFRLAENVFRMPLDDKLPYKMDGKNGIYYGYKPARTTFTDKHGTPDTIEFWNISKDELLVRNGNDFPKAILDVKDVIKSFMIKSHEMINVILEILSISLGLDAKALSNLHRLMESSGDQLRFTKTTMHPIQNRPSSPDVSLGAHTDFGSITILFNRLYGLQVLSPNKEWLFVPPLPGHAVVNLGDAMVKLSGGRLMSNTHRVVTAPGLSAVTDRYSVVYFARPENVVQMKNLLSDEVNETDNLTAEEWIARRVRHFQIVNYTNEEAYELSRGTESYVDV